MFIKKYYKPCLEHIKSKNKENPEGSLGEKHRTLGTPAYLSCESSSTKALTCRQQKVRHLSRRFALMILILSLGGCANLKPRLAQEDGLNREENGLSRVEIKAVLDGKPLSGAVARFLPKTPDGFGSTPVFTSRPTDEKGKTSLLVTSGSYYLVALKKNNPGPPGLPEAGDRFCFYGGNPVFFGPGESSRVGLNLKPVKPLSKSKAAHKLIGGNSGIRGRVTYGGKPLGGSRIYIYLDGASHFRGPGSLELSDIGADGRFEIELPPGKYYVIAKKRQDGGWSGPLRKDDYFGYLPQNPVQVTDGEFLEFDLECISKTRPRKRKVSTYIKAGAIAVTGTIRDQNGKPIAGAFAFAYENRTMNGKRPPYVSRQTGADGRYVLNFEKPGRYYIGARDTTGGPPLPGELYGEYDGSGNGVELKKKEVRKNIDVYLKVVE